MDARSSLETSPLSAHGKLARYDKQIARILHDKAQASLDDTRILRFVIWPMLLSYLSRNQWLQRTVVPAQGLYWADNDRVARDVRATINIIRPRHRQFVSLASRAKPGWVATPQTDSESGRRRALVNTMWLDHQLRSTNAPLARWQVMNAVSALGSGYWMPTYDPTRGRPIENLEPARELVTGQPVTDSFLGKVRGLFDTSTQRLIPKQKTQMTGEFGFETFSPYEMLPPAGVRTCFVETWPFAQTMYVSDEGSLERRYGARAKGLSSSEAPHTWGLDQAALLPGLSPVAGGSEFLQGPRSGIVVHCYREPPSDRPGYSRGREVHHVDGTHVLLDQELPAPEAGIGIHGFYLDWDPGSPFCLGLVELLMTLQDLMNRMVTRFMRWLARGIDPTLFVPAMSGITEERMKSGYEKIVPYDALRGAPTWMTPPALPPQLFTMIGMIEVIADRISGMQPLARGEMTRGLPSGVVIQLIQEAMESVFSSFAQLSAYSMARTGQHMLALGRQVYTSRGGELLIPVMGADNAYEFMKAAPGDLGEIDLQVQETSMLPRLDAARKQQVREDLGMGIFGNPQDPAVLQSVRRQLDQPATLQTSMPGEADRALAEHEDRVMLELGQPQKAAISQFDNHFIHLYQHILRTRDRTYGELPTDVVKQHLAHIQAHQQAQQQQKEAERQEQLRQFREVEKIKAEMSAFRTQQAMIANIESAKAAALIRANLGQPVEPPPGGEGRPPQQEAEPGA